MGKTSIAKGRRAEQTVARRIRTAWPGVVVERRGLGQRGLPDLVLSYDGRPLPLFISVKAVAAARAAGIVTRPEMTSQWWKEVDNAAGRGWLPMLCLVIQRFGVWSAFPPVPLLDFCGRPPAPYVVWSQQEDLLTVLIQFDSFLVWCEPGRLLAAFPG